MLTLHAGISVCFYIKPRNIVIQVNVIVPVQIHVNKMKENCCQQLYPTSKEGAVILRF